MATDVTATAHASDAEVMASVDPSPDGDELVLADLSREEAWLSTSVTAARPLDDWR
jgi:hypothetical protein